MLIYFLDLNGSERFLEFVLDWLHLWRSDLFARMYIKHSQLYFNNTYIHTYIKRTHFEVRPLNTAGTLVETM